MRERGSRTESALLVAIHRLSAYLPLHHTVAALAPQLLRAARRLEPAQRAYGTLLLVAIVSAVLLHLSRIVAAAYLAVVVTISVLCPLLLGNVLAVLLASWINNLSSKRQYPMYW